MNVTRHIAWNRTTNNKTTINNFFLAVLLASYNYYGDNMVLMDSGLKTLFDDTYQIPDFYQSNNIDLDIYNFCKNELNLYHAYDLIQLAGFKNLEDVFKYNFYIVDDDDLYFVYPEELYDYFDKQMIEERNERVRLEYE